MILKEGTQSCYTCQWSELNIVDIKDLQSDPPWPAFPFTCYFWCLLWQCPAFNQSAYPQGCLSWKAGPLVWEMRKLERPNLSKEEEPPF